MQERLKYDAKIQPNKLIENSFNSLALMAKDKIFVANSNQSWIHGFSEMSSHTPLDPLMLTEIKYPNFCIKLQSLIPELKKRQNISVPFLLFILQ